MIYYSYIEDASDVFRAVSTLASDKDDNGSFPFIENSASHILMKRLIANDKERIEAGKSGLFTFNSIRSNSYTQYLDVQIV